MTATVTVTDEWTTVDVIVDGASSKDEAIALAFAASDLGAYTRASASSSVARPERYFVELVFVFLSSFATDEA